MEIGDITASPIISIRNVSRTWKNFSLKDITLDIMDGEYFVILGPTGAGKSLFLELIAGFYRLDSGKIIYKGRNAEQLPPEKRNIGFVYQDYILFPHKTVEGNIKYSLNYISHERRNKFSERLGTKDLFQYLIDKLGIRHLINRYPYTLSGGERQRVSIARAIYSCPDLLLLDEPFSAIDSTLKYSLRRFIKRLNRRAGITVIHVTHDQQEAINIADRIGIIISGKLVQVGPPEEIYYRPASDEIADFLGIENIYKGRIVSVGETGVLRVRVGDITLESVLPRKNGFNISKSDEVRVCIRPEHVTLISDNILDKCDMSMKTSARNCYMGTVLYSEHYGPYFLVHIDIGVEITSLITSESMEKLDIKKGDKIIVSFKASSVHIII